MTITTKIEAANLSDLTEEWKVVGYSTAPDFLWGYTLPSHDIATFRSRAFDTQPSISVCQGPDGEGVYLLYARLMPAVKKRPVVTTRALRHALKVA